MQTVLSHEALKLSTSGQVAQSYFALLAIDMQLETAKRTLRSREESLRIYTSRYKQGDITELALKSRPRAPRSIPRPLTAMPRKLPLPC